MQRTIKHSGPLLLAILLATGSAAASAKTYRWTDAEGNVHYSDRVPVEHIDRARTELDKRGLEKQRLEAAKTEEELAREEELKRLRAHEQRLIEQQQEKDRVLLRTFRYEEDILMTRDGKLASIDTSIQIIRSNIRRLKEKLANMQKNAADTERQGQSISSNYLKEIEGTRRQLKDSYASIIHMEQNKQLIREKHQADLKRFRQLKNLNPDQPEKQEKPKGRNLLETVVVCSDQEQCDRLWQRAESYVRQHATTRMQLLAESIIMTAVPIKDDDISITVSRIEEQEPQETKLFMDLQCKESPRGKDLCETAQTDEIRGGFRIFLGSSEPAPPGPGAGD